MKTKSIIGIEEIDRIVSPRKRREHILAYNFIKSPSGKIYRVSTVHLDYFSGLKPLNGEQLKELDEALGYNIYKQPYETAVFLLGSDNDIFMAHYKAKEDALKGHSVIMRLILEDGIKRLQELNIASERPWWEKFLGEKNRRK